MKIYAYALNLALIGLVFASDATNVQGAKSTFVGTSAKSGKSLTTSGSVLSVDMIGNTIAIEGKKKVQWIFSVPANAKIIEGKKPVVLGDITVGFKVKVIYTKENDTLMASKILVWPAKKKIANLTGK